MSYARFSALIGEINDILSALNLLAWDGRTQMPQGGVATRAAQVETLTGIARDRACSTELADAIAGAREELAPGDPRHRALDLAARETGVLARIPARLITATAELSARAHSAWVAARAANDFAGYAPILEQVMAMSREMAAAIGHDGHPYDAHLGRFEPGMTTARLDALFAELRAGLLPLVERARAAPQPRSDFLSRGFPVPAQKAFAAEFASRFGYDLSRGRIDDTAHPFEISMSRDDVRITGRFREGSASAGFFALWHEAGHGMYEQGVDPAYRRTIFTTDLVNLYAVAGASFGIHESQSRLWENRVARSPRFWELHLDDLRRHFPGKLDDVTPGEFWAAVNRVAPGLIRVEADELTYDLHIMLRAGIEAALMTGDLPVADLPAVWNRRMRDDLGVEVPTDADGVLQDVHWSHGYVGSFPTYTLGNVMAAQFHAAALTDGAVAAGLESGDYAPLRDWLGRNVHRHGRAQSPDETLRAVTGRGLDTADYIAALTAKVDRLTGRAAE